MAFKKVILKISIGFVVFLFILTFFSRTILDMGIPSIALIDSYSSGLIQYTTTLNGTVDYSKKKLVYSPVSGNIEILVKNGDRILNGQPLFMVKSDIKTQTEMLGDLKYEKELIELRLDQTINDKVFANKKLAQLKSELNSIDSKEINAQSLLQQARDRIDDQNRYILNYDYQILQYKMELERNEEKSQKILSAIQTGDSYIVTAELDKNEGIISDIKFNINNNNYIYKDNVVLEIGIVNDVYIAEIITPEINKNIKVNTHARIILNENICNGMVRNIVSENDMKIITIQFKSETVVADQKASVVIGGSPKLYDFVLPNSAVMKDADNKSYIHTVEARKRQFGYDYYVVKLKVDVLDQDEKNTAIGGYYSDINIIGSSDMPICEGTRVKIMNGSDFDAIR